MSTTDVTTSAAVAPRTLALEFRGSGVEFFRIWIVNISLTILTLGVYSAWARVRTKRYFYGNTYMDGHSFDYHASPWRILVGRIIAVVVLLIYNVTASITPAFALLWLLAFFLALPWLINSSLRFNARNTSYRNVRFNFDGNYGSAFVAHIGWPIIGVLTLGALIPLARRARDYYTINNHTYGNMPFFTQYKGWRIYVAYLIGIACFIALYVGATAVIIAAMQAFYTPPAVDDTAPNHLGNAAVTLPWWYFGILYLVLGTISLLFLAVRNAVDAMVFNLGVGNTRLADKHALVSKLFPPAVAWINVSNILLTLLTLGLFYPFARIRLARYQARKMALIAATDLSEFKSESFGGQNAIGEEIGSVFDVDLGL